MAGEFDDSRQVAETLSERDPIPSVLIFQTSIQSGLFADKFPDGIILAPVPVALSPNIRGPQPGQQSLFFVRSNGLI
jgi:hypothetical protein